jgi:putative phage-type endonuclease
MEITAAVLKEPEIKRSHYLGGTDCAAILGLSRWKTPLQVWGEKTGLIEPEDISDRLAVKLGNRLEQAVAELFTEETGLKVRRVNEPIFDREYPFLGGRIDRRVVGENSIVECKTTSAWKAKEWESAEIPHEYILQVMHYLMVTGADKAYIAVLIGNQDFKWKEVLRDEALIADIKAREIAFWKGFVETKIMPAQINKRDAETLYSLYPVAAEGITVNLTDEAVRLIESRNALIQDKIGLEGMIDQHENEIKALLKDAETGLAGKWKVTWKNQETNRFDTTRFKAEDPFTYNKFIKTTETRVLRIKEAA